MLQILISEDGVRGTVSVASYVDIEEDSHLGERRWQSGSRTSVYQCHGRQKEYVKHDYRKYYRTKGSSIDFVDSRRQKLRLSVFFASIEF